MSPRILQVFNRYLQYGGEEGSVGRIATALREAVTLETYYGSTADSLGGVTGKLRMPLTMLRNERVLDDLRRLQSERRFDFWQVHNVFPAVSVAVYELAAELGVPVVQYLHNYRFGCASATYFVGGEVCHRCRPGAYMPGVVRRCWRGSLPATVAMVMALNRFWKRGMSGGIRAFIAISERQKALHVEMGLPAERIHVLHHFLDAGPEPGNAPPPDGDVIYLGRVTEEKGVLLLLRAWAGVSAAGRRLRIVGDGPALPEAKALAGELGLKNVCFDGFVEREEHPAIWREAAFSVAPSIWEEPFGMVVLEAWKHGRPVLATDLGSFPEMVTDGEDGWLAPVDVAGFSEVLQRALGAGGKCAAMGRAGRNGLKSSFSRAAWLERITGYYRDAGLMKQ